MTIQSLIWSGIGIVIFASLLTSCNDIVERRGKASMEFKMACVKNGGSFIKAEGTENCIVGNKKD